MAILERSPPQASSGALPAFVWLRETGDCGPGRPERQCALYVTRCSPPPPQGRGRGHPDRSAACGVRRRPGSPLRAPRLHLCAHSGLAFPFVPRAGEALHKDLRRGAGPERCPRLPTHTHPFRLAAEFRPIPLPPKSVLLHRESPFENEVVVELRNAPWIRQLCVFFFSAHSNPSAGLAVGGGRIQARFSPAPHGDTRARELTGVLLTQLEIPEAQCKHIKFLDLWLYKSKWQAAFDPAAEAYESPSWNMMV
ncbi:uncharacterized protein LOC109491390 [Felis catus]|uniref:uncharacterized protein LOC109491390 n=1 Tax=Felis catus TaxID=9685 RepID=UPI001D198ECA|nr:uncharacterized protein LOC109491390 [Felis catus]